MISKMKNFLSYCCQKTVGPGFALGFYLQGTSPKLKLKLTYCTVMTTNLTYWDWDTPEDLPVRLGRTAGYSSHKG